MPAGAEAVRAEKAARRAQRAAADRDAPPQPIADTGEGVAIVRASWAGTVVFVVGAVVAALVADARLFAVILDLVLFLGGCAIFFWALAAAAQRSRDREIGLWNLFLLDGVAPPTVRTPLLASLAIQIAVALGTAWVAVPLAFGILVPVWGLSCSGLWGAKYGRFGPRRPAPPRPSRRARSSGNAT
jgi:hypothetical protein